MNKKQSCSTCGFFGTCNLTSDKIHFLQNKKKLIIIRQLITSSVKKSENFKPLLDKNPKRNVKSS